MIRRPPRSTLDRSSAASDVYKRQLGFWLRYVSNHVSHAFSAKLAAKGVTVAEWVMMRALYGKSEIPPLSLIHISEPTRPY